MSQFISANKVTLLGFLLIAAFIISILWLDKKEHGNNISKKLPEQQPAQADYFMENYSIISVNKEGRAFRWLSGKTLTHYPNNKTDLSNPTLQFSHKEQHWLLSAKNGNIQETDKIEFDGDVQIHQLNGRTKTLNISADHLDISLKNNTASTPGNVLVNNKNSEIKATGMNIDFNNHRLQLLSNVKGKYGFE